jgi:hypothetical protein
LDEKEKERKDQEEKENNRKEIEGFEDYLLLLLNRLLPC